MHIAFGQRAIVVTVAGQRIPIDRRSRLAASTALVLMMHVLVFWGMTLVQPRPLDLTYDDRNNVIDTELYRLEPEPEPIPEVEPVPQPTRHVAEQPQQKQQPQPVPPQTQAQQQQQQQATQPVPAPQPVPVPDPSLAVAPRPVDSFQKAIAPTAQKQADARLKTDAAPLATVEPDPSLTKKKKQEEEKLDANPQLANTSTASDLKLHESPSQAITATAPSGLSPDNSHLASNPPAGGSAGAGAAGGRAGGGGAPGAAALGALKGGRSGVTQALQNHDSCVAIQTAGKPLPAGCNMKSLAEMKGLGLKPDAGLQAAAAARDANLNYKTQAGNADYWKRVNAGPQSRYEPGDGTPKPGQYANPKDDKVMNGINGDPKAKVSY